MTIKVKCQCGRALKAKSTLAGKRVKCPAYGQGVCLPERPKTDQSANENTPVGNQPSEEGLFHFDPNDPFGNNSDEPEGKPAEPLSAALDMGPLREPAGNALGAPWMSQSVQHPVATTTPSPSPTVSNDEPQARYSPTKILQFAGIAVFAVVAFVGLLIGGVGLIFSDKPDAAVKKQLVGEYNLRVYFVWQDVDGKRSPMKEVETSTPRVHVSHSWSGWKVDFFGEKWTGRTEDLDDLQLVCPFDRVVEALPEIKEVKPQGSADSLGRVMRLAMSDGEMVVSATGIPQPRAPVAEKTYYERRDRFGKVEGNADNLPSDAIIKSQTERIDSSGSMKMITATIPGKEGAHAFSCMLIKPSAN